MNFNLLRAKIVEMGYNMKTFSKATGINRVSLYRRLSGEVEFDRKEIDVISNVLSLNSDQIFEIFFARQVS